jgi:hypothetical protein
VKTYSYLIILSSYGCIILYTQHLRTVIDTVAIFVFMGLLIFSSLNKTAGIKSVSLCVTRCNTKMTTFEVTSARNSVSVMFTLLLRVFMKREAETNAWISVLYTDSLFRLYSFLLYMRLCSKNTNKYGTCYCCQTFAVSDVILWHRVFIMSIFFAPLLSRHKYSRISWELGAVTIFLSFGKRPSQV